MSECEKTSEKVMYARGARKAGSKLARKTIPAMPAPESTDPDAGAKREAYQLAKSNRHKPWARRYLRALRPGGFY